MISNYRGMAARLISFFIVSFIFMFYFSTPACPAEIDDPTRQGISMPPMISASPSAATSAAAPESSPPLFNDEEILISSKGRRIDPLDKESSYFVGHCLFTTVISKISWIMAHRSPLG